MIALLGIGSAWAWDFSAVAPSGQTLYYYIISATDQTCGVTNNDNDRPSGTLVIPAEVEYNGINYSVTTIGYGAYNSCPGLTSVTIPGSVTTIGELAFINCSGLTSVNLPESLTHIGMEAFENCSSLTSVNLPESLTYIDAGAFINCSSITSVTIPESVGVIGYLAFGGCSGLTSVTYNARDCAMGEWNYGFRLIIIIQYSINAPIFPL